MTITAQTKRYVQYHFGGLLAPETSTREITDLDQLHLTMPESALGYRTFERSSSVVDGETLLGEAKNYSPWTFYGRRMTLADVERELPNESNLIANMRDHPQLDVVQTPGGRHFQLQPDDRVLPAR
jgi:hypothetical protein